MTRQGSSTGFSSTLTCCRLLLAVPFLIQVSANSARGQTNLPDFNVTVRGTGYGNFEYVINGRAGTPRLDIFRGKTYVFAIDTSSMHPFQIETIAGVPYNDGLSTNNIYQGKITWVVSPSAPEFLRYRCSVHSFYNFVYPYDPLPPAAFGIVSMTVTNNSTVLKSLGTNGWNAIPEFSSNLVSSNWVIVPNYTNTFANGTNVAIFNRLDLICGSNVFLRVRNMPVPH
jgi:hypothetical protein